MGLIILFILILNIVAIVLTYHCLSDLEQKEKMIFIAVGIALMYILTSAVYGLSTKEISIKEVAETGKNVITFLFVPINGLIVLPIFAKSYEKYKMGTLSSRHLRNRGIVLGIILFVILIIEFSNFKDIQNGVIRQLQAKYEKRVQIIQKEESNNENSDNSTQVEAPIITSNELGNNTTNKLNNTSEEDKINTNEGLENQTENDIRNEI